MVRSVTPCSRARAEALVQADYHERSLTLWVRGPQAGQYFRYLHQDICRILRLMPDLRFREWVTVAESTRIKGDVDNLTTMSRE